MNSCEAFALFRSLHTPGPPLLLPNVWDGASAAVAAATGAPALATTSAGIAWSLGLPDGGGLGRAAAALPRSSPFTSRP